MGAGVGSGVGGIGVFVGCAEGVGVEVDGKLAAVGEGVAALCVPGAGFVAADTSVSNNSADAHAR